MVMHCSSLLASVLSLWFSSIMHTWIHHTYLPGCKYVEGNIHMDVRCCLNVAQCAVNIFYSALINSDNHFCPNILFYHQKDHGQYCRQNHGLWFCRINCLEYTQACTLHHCIIARLWSAGLHCLRASHCCSPCLISLSQRLYAFTLDLD